MQDKAGADDGAESRGGAEIDASDNKDNKRVKEKCVWWDTKALMHLAYVFGEDESIIASKGERQARGGLLTSVESKDAGEEEKDDEDRSGGLGLRRLVPNLIDGDSSWSHKDRIEVRNAIEHGDYKCEGRHKADDNGGHEGLRDGRRSVDAVLRKMNGSIKTGVHKIGVYQASKEDYSVGPAGIIDEGVPHIFVWLLGAGDGETCNEKDDKAEQGQCDWYGR